MNGRVIYQAAACIVVAMVAAGCVKAMVWYQPQVISEAPPPSESTDRIYFTVPGKDWVCLRFWGPYYEREMGPANFRVDLYKNLPLLDRDASDEELNRRDEMRNRHIAVSLESTRITVVPDKGAPQEFELKVPYGGTTDFVLSINDWYNKFELAGRAPDYFDVHFPAISFDGEKVVVPPIRFTLRFGVLPQRAGLIPDLARSDRHQADCSDRYY